MNIRRAPYSWQLMLVVLSGLAGCRSTPPTPVTPPPVPAANVPSNAPAADAESLAHHDAQARHPSN